MNLIVIIFLLNLSLLYGKDSPVPPIQNAETYKRILCQLFPKSLKGECQTKWKKNNDWQIDVTKSKQCFMCDHIVQYIGPNVDRSETPKNIQKKLLKTCEIFSKPLKLTCVKFCTENGLKVVDKLFKMESPNRICENHLHCEREDKHGKAIGKSAEGNIDSRFVGNDVHSGKKSPPIQCYLCKQIMDILEKLIGIDQTREQLKAMIKEVCWLVPASQTDKCIIFVDEYMDVIIDFIFNDENPKKICHLLNICLSEVSKSDETLYFLPKTSYNF